MKGKLLLTVPLSPFCLSGPAARVILLKHKSSEASLFKTLYWLPPHSEERPKSLQNGLHGCAPPHSHHLSSAALSPRPRGDRLATVTSSSLTHAKHAPTSGLGTCSSLRLLLTLSFLSSLRSKVITVEAFSDHCALCAYSPRPTFFLTYASFRFSTALTIVWPWSIHIFISCLLPHHQNTYCMRAGLCLLCSQLYPQHQEQIQVLHDYLLSFGLTALSSQSWSVIWFHDCYFRPFCLSRQETGIL